MALQTSGPISFSDINQELGNSSTDTLSLNSSDIRNLTPNSTYADALHGVGINTTSGTTISMYELYGASAESITFSFNNITNADRGVYYSRSSLVTGIVGSVSAIAGPGDQVSLNSLNWYSSVTISNDQVIFLRTLSSTNFSTSTTASVTIGGVTGSFTITTEAIDTTPDNFSFSDFTNASVSTLYSRSTTITGINTSVTATAGSGDEVSLNGSTWSSSVTVTNGATLYLRTLSSSSFNTSTTASVTVGGVTGDFTITTREASATLTPSSRTLSIFDDTSPFSGYAGIQLHETGGVNTFSLGTIIDGVQSNITDNQWTSDPRSAFQARATITSGTPSSAVSFTDFGTGTSVGSWADVTGSNYIWAWGATSETTSTFTVKLEIRAKVSQTVLTSSLITLNFELVDIGA